MKALRITYWASTGLLSILLFFSANMYFFKFEYVSEEITGLGYPPFIIIPLGIAKILAVVTLVGLKFRTLREWAYFGLMVDFLLAAQAHAEKGDSTEVLFPLLALVLLVISYYTWKKEFPWACCDSKKEKS